MATCDLYECFNNRAHTDWIVPPSLTTQYAVSARFSWIVEGSSSLHTGQPQRSKDDQKQRVSKCHQPIDRYMYHGSIGSWSQIYIDLFDVLVPNSIRDWKGTGESLPRGFIGSCQRQCHQAE